MREITEYLIPRNGLRVLYARRPGTGVITTNILYFVGSRDEARGETGIAHMLEHMLFKPTEHDLVKRLDSASMRFEREFGITLNANTWKDRTTYYFSYPKEHFDRALRIEAERMRSVVISDTEFKPEQGNVLSEFDMYAGDEHFALSVAMAGAAFESHTYGHETIGFREDIGSYTVEKLRRFYDNFYAPGNAMLMVVGDVSEADMARGVMKHFGKLENPTLPPVRTVLREPKQEGRRFVEVRRPATTNVYGIGVKHAAFPSKEWFETVTVFDMLAGGEDSILHKELVDSGMATSLDSTVEPTKDPNLAILFITLSPRTTHEKVAKKLRSILTSLTARSVIPYLQKTIAKEVTHEFVSRENSLGYTAELVEYASADAWTGFFETEAMLRSITPEDILARITELFREENITEGWFVGTKKKGT